MKRRYGVSNRRRPAVRRGQPSQSRNTSGKANTKMNRFMDTPYRCSTTSRYKRHHETFRPAEAEVFRQSVMFFRRRRPTVSQIHRRAARWTGIEMKQLQETVRSEVERRAAVGSRPLDGQQAAMHQNSQNVMARLASQLADPLGRDRLFIGRQSQHIDRGLRQPGFSKPSVETPAERMQVAAERQPIAGVVADDAIRGGSGVHSGGLTRGPTREFPRRRRRASVRRPVAASAAGFRGRRRKAWPPKWSAD